MKCAAPKCMQGMTAPARTAAGSFRQLALSAHLRDRTKYSVPTVHAGHECAGLRCRQQLVSFAHFHNCTEYGPPKCMQGHECAGLRCSRHGSPLLSPQPPREYVKCGGMLGRWSPGSDMEEEEDWPEEKPQVSIRLLAHPWGIVVCTVKRANVLLNCEVAVQPQKSRRFGLKFELGCPRREEESKTV
eukprot:scaffold42073_cov22-Tisochrysis_lutea.AAC.1